MQKERFNRPEPGFSLYEGRTRGKRMKYTYSDNEDDSLTDTSIRRSSRNTRNHTPAEPAGPVITASGRQSRAPARLNMENAGDAPSASTSIQGDDVDMDEEDSVGPRGRPRRSAAVNHGTNGWSGSKKRKSEEYESEESDEGSEPEFGDDEEEEHVPDDDDDDEEEFDEESPLEDDLEVAAEGESGSFVFKFPIRVSIDDDNKVHQIPGPPVELTSPHRNHPRAARRNVVVSESSESATDSTGEEDPIVPEPEPPAAESIAVATKQRARTPEKTPVTLTTAVEKPTTATAINAKPPLTPSSAPSTSLAFRGSPDKPLQAQPQSINVGNAE